MSELSISARVGWADDPATSVRERMSPGLRARVAAADVEYDRQGEREARQRQVRVELAHERAVLEAAREKASQEGIPLTQAMRTVGHTPAEFVALRSAMADVEDARAEAERTRLMRRLAADAGLLDVSEVEPSERAVGWAAEIAVRTWPADQPFDPQAAAKGIRARWRKAHR
jgi:hypothetical protein